MIDLVLGVVDDVGELLGEQPDVERVQHRAHDGTAKYASRCSWVFQQNVPTRSPFATPSSSSACGEPVRVVADLGERRAPRRPSSVHVTHSLSAYTRSPWRRIAVIVSGKSCIVLSMVMAGRNLATASSAERSAIPSRLGVESARRRRRERAASTAPASIATPPIATTGRTRLVEEDRGRARCR